MPRLTRKIGHLTGEMSQMSSTARRNNLSARVSLYDNNASISTIKKEKYTMVRHPLRTKMSTIAGSANASKSLLGVPGMQGMPGGSSDPEQVLRELKLMQKEKLNVRSAQYNASANATGQSTNAQQSAILPAIKK